MDFNSEMVAMVVLCLFVLMPMKRLRVPPRFIALRTEIVPGVVVVLDVDVLGGHGAIQLRFLGVILGE
jgi:hypothetical protein